MTKHKLEFIIEVKNKAVKRKRIDYNFPQLCYTSISYSKKFGNFICVSFDPLEDFPYNQKIYNIAEAITLDWSVFEIKKCPDFILGITNLSDNIIFIVKDAKESMIDMLTLIINQTFDQKFVDNYTGKNQSFMFTVDFLLDKDICKLISFKSKEII